MERHQEVLPRNVTQNSERPTLTPILTGKHVYWVVKTLVNKNFARKYHCNEIYQLTIRFKIPLIPLRCLPGRKISPWNK